MEVRCTGAERALGLESEDLGPQLGPSIILLTVSVPHVGKVGPAAVSERA